MTELSERAQRLLDQARDAELPSQVQRLRAEQVLRRRLQIAGQAVGVLGASLSAAAATSTAATSTAAASTAAASTAAASTAAKVAATLGSSTGIAGSVGAAGAASVGAAGAGFAGMSVAGIGAKLVVSAVIGIAGASVGHEVITRVAPAQSVSVSVSVAEVAPPARSSSERQHEEASNPAELSRAALFPATATSEQPVAPVEAPMTSHAPNLSASPVSASSVSASPVSASPVQRVGQAGKGHPAPDEPRASEPQRLAQEVSDLEQAQQLLGQGRPEHAIALLEESQRKHAPAGALRGLSTERSALLALSYCAAHDPARRARGEQLARQFLLAHPNSPLSARVRSECNAD